MVGLHLDLVRMGGTWRREMRAAMQEYVGDLKDGPLITAETEVTCDHGFSLPRSRTHS
jgi:hypothetical protein